MPIQLRNMLILSHLVVFILFFFTFGIGIAFADDTYTGDLPPATVGAECNDSIVYHWSTETKTVWRVSSVLAVPDGHLPGDWDGTTAFLDAIQESTAGNRNTDTLAATLLSEWDRSFQSPALLYGKFERSIATETRDLQCIGGIRQIQPGSYIVTNVPDRSEWVRIFQEAQDHVSIMAQDVVDQINRVLATVNSQPGADVRPFHKYTVTGS